MGYTVGTGVATAQKIVKRPTMVHHLPSQASPLWVGRVIPNNNLPHGLKGNPPWVKLFPFDDDPPSKGAQGGGYNLVFWTQICDGGSKSDKFGQF